jgi:drug/metabolite transporter (DMT)-like permease
VLSMHSLELLLVAALFAYAGIVVGNYTICVGISGVVVAIYNANAFIHVSLSAIFLKQEISKVQLIGVFVLLIGAVFISLGDNIWAKIRAKTN